MTIWTELTGTPFSLEYVDAAGVATRSLQAGPADGPPLIFLHGTSGHLEAFIRNLESHAAAGFRCHAIDMLGHGYTGKPDYRYEIPRYVEHLAHYMDACGMQSAHIVGESLGGWVAGWLASEQPERIRSLQMVAAGGTKANPEIMARIKNSTTKAVNEDDISLTRDRLHLLMFDGEKDVSEELVQIRHDIYHQESFKQNLSNLLCLQEMEIRVPNLMTNERLGMITAPTLVVWGKDNPFGEVPEANNMHAAIKGSELELIPECGHWPQHEQADIYNRVSIDFLLRAEG